MGYKDVCGFRECGFTCFGFHVSGIVFGTSGFMFQVTDFYILIRSCRFHILRFAVFFSCQLSGFRFPVLLFGFTASHDTFLLASFKTLVFCLHVFLQN